MINPIAFGVSLLLGILIIIFEYRKFLLNQFNFKKFSKIIFTFFFLSFLLSSLHSHNIQRSIPVFAYLIGFIIVSYSLFCCLKKDFILLQQILKYFVLSSYLNIIFIFAYDLYHFDYETYAEVKKFKGILNIITITTLLIPLFKKSKLNLLIFLPLIPSIIMSNCNSSFLGIILACITCVIFHAYLNIFKSKFFLTFLLLLSLVFSSLLIKSLPEDFNKTSIDNFEFKISTQLIDAHRQFIWGFSLSKFKERLGIGYGPDTSNFIDGSQEIIGHKSTGDMTYIPSHPHNFFIELLLETGIFGTVSFFLFLILINIHIYRRSILREKYILIFYNTYFWSTSLVNFSFWLGWWQGSYFFLLALITSRNFSQKKK